ncbi:hypothetical protein [Oceanobacillus alkalisoli]|uniref:hypothetical protein n=1 Tax=Oceanobacillus alkalisoli TaxID=2925113 RepID=UPI001EE476DB|nr:hypothetical protein [Oceanobacillus alkalisoli]MCG5102542.1 hypothetical protein [Oceanobacillus alkalisoli]
MNNIKLLSPQQFSGTAEELKDNLEEKLLLYHSPTTYANTEASLLWIIRGCIDYFDTLDPSFLGKGNASGVPSMEADHFVNNVYRLTNAIDYLARLWKIEIQKSDELKFLLDIRTLIVHSGEQLTKIESLKLEGFKDSQLGRIFHRQDCNPFRFLGEFSHMDYCLVIWNDKHDRNKKNNLSEVDYHIKNESYRDLSIYLKSSDIRNILLSYIQDFLDTGNGRKTSTKVKKLPDIKDRVINEEEKNINFDTIAKLISKDLRGGYFKENGIEYWKGFGLKRLYEYSQRRIDIPDEVKKIIMDKIQNVISEYWGDYQNEQLSADELPNLDIREVFADYTPTFEHKHYLERQKLFGHIAPFFNTKNRHDATDIDYLARFINEASAALGKQLNLEQTVDHLVCDYFVQSIQVKMENEQNLKSSD